MKIKYLFKRSIIISFLFFASTLLSMNQRVTSPDSHPNSYSKPQGKKFGFKIKKRQDPSKKLDSVQEYISMMLDRTDVYLASNSKILSLSSMVAFGAISQDTHRKFVKENRELLEKNLEHGVHFLSYIEKLEEALTKGCFEEPGEKSDKIMQEMRFLYLDRTRGLKAKLEPLVTNARAELS